MKKRKQNLYIISIDASKAFDKVSRTILWLRLHKMDINFTLIYCLMKYYENFYIIIKNEIIYSELFQTKCGFKQGGPISPNLYKLYSEVIATTIDKLDIGIVLGKLKINILMYADDIIILADNTIDAQTMLDCVTEFGIASKIKFNPEKTNVMVVGNKTIPFRLKLCGKNIVLVDEIKYLGVMLNKQDKARAHINKRKQAAYASYNSLKTTGIINKYMDPISKMKLFNIYIRPILSYGLETLMINGDELKIYTRADGNLMKQMIGLPHTVKSTQLYDTFGINTPETNLIINKIKLFLRMQYNTYTDDIIVECLENNETDGLVGEIMNILGVNTNSLYEINEFAENYVNKTKLNQNDRRKSDEIKDLIQLVNTRNTYYIIHKLKLKLAY